MRDVRRELHCAVGIGHRAVRFVGDVKEIGAIDVGDVGFRIELDRVIEVFIRTLKVAQHGVGVAAVGVCLGKFEAEHLAAIDDLRAR